MKAVKDVEKLTRPDFLVYNRNQLFSLGFTYRMFSMLPSGDVNAGTCFSRKIVIESLKDMKNGVYAVRPKDIEVIDKLLVLLDV